MTNVQAHFDSKNVIIWDWNGTLLNDVEACHRSVCRILGENGLNEITLDTHREKFLFPIRNFYSDLGFDFDRVSYEELSERYHVIFREEVQNASLFENAKDFLHTTREQGKSHYILSACHQDDLNKQVSEHEIIEHFVAVYGQNDLLAHSKIARGKQLIQDFNINPDDALFIGDTDHDLEVGQALGIETILVAQGHQSYERLSSKHSKVLQSTFFV